jgi:hypothetical protein
LGTKVELFDPLLRVKQNNINDEARGITGMLVSDDMKFHAQGIETPNAVSIKLE